MKKILLVSYYFPPVAASGAMRPLAFCRFLGSYGWQCRILTTDADSIYLRHPVDLELSRKIPSTVCVDVVPHGNPLQRLLAWREQFRALLWKKECPEEQVGGPNTLPADGSTAGGAVSSTKRLLLDWAFEFPDPHCGWLRSATAYAKQLNRTEIPAIVFATGGPWTSLLVGQCLAQFWGVPFIADYRDPWTSNPYVSFPSDWLNAKARRLEESVLRMASRVITNTDELRLQLEKDYPGLTRKSLTITNGFDPFLFNGITTDERSNQGPTGTVDRALQLWHFGTVYGKRSPRVLLQTLVALYESGRLSSSQICLRFVGSWEVNEASCEQLAQQLEKLGLFKREPPVPYQTCLRLMTKADALLAIQPDSPLQIPGKIYEYVATRRPILLIGGEGATANLVQRHRVGLTASNHVDHIRRLILDVVEGRQSLSVPGSEEVDRFNYQSLTGKLAKVLDEVYQEKGRKLP